MGLCGIKETTQQCNTSCFSLFPLIFLLLLLLHLLFLDEDVSGDDQGNAIADRLYNQRGIERQTIVFKRFCGRWATSIVGTASKQKKKNKRSKGELSQLACAAPSIVSQIIVHEHMVH
jgi:hypothetical protein